MDLQIRMERETIPFTSMASEPDPNWRFTDKAGHEHWWTGKGYPGWNLLAVQPTESWWCMDCREYHEDGHLVCRLCGEIIHPGYVGPSPFVRTLPGLVTVTATLRGYDDDGREWRTVWSLSPDQYEEIKEYGVLECIDYLIELPALSMQIG